MVGSVGEAEDLVQEAFLRLHRARRTCESPKAFLTTVVTRLAIDHLRSARVRRETYTGDVAARAARRRRRRPEPAVEHDETVSLALLRAARAAQPVERAVFVLREVFDFAYDEIARDRRQERRQLPPDPAPCAAARRRGAAAVRAVARAARGAARALPRRRARRRRRRARRAAGRRRGARRDGGGKARATTVPILGGDKVARLWAAFGGAAEAAAVDLVAVDVNGQPGVAAVAPDGGLVAVHHGRRRRRPRPARLGGAQPGQAGGGRRGGGRGARRPRARRRLVQRHVRLDAVHPALAHAGPAAVERVDLADAVAQRELAPVARVQVLLELVRGRRAS